MKEYSWPFVWSRSTKHIRDKMDMWVDATPNTNKCITLTKADYDLLISKLPVEYTQCAKPVYRSRIIKRWGEA